MHSPLGFGVDPFSLEKLLYWSSESFAVDEAAFQEMRSNILMDTGKHHAPMGGAGISREFARHQRRPSNRLLITLNQIPRLADAFVNELYAHGPDVTVAANDEGDIRASRLAQLNRKVWGYHKTRSESYQERVDKNRGDFIVVGEVANKFYWDNQSDWVKGESMLPFNVGRAPASDSCESSPWLFHRNVYSKDRIYTVFGPEWGKRIIESGQSDYGDQPFASRVIFDSQTREYMDQQNAIELTEFYFRPNKYYPKGYYCFFLPNWKIAEGELPGGIFPIVTGRCMITTGMPRGHSFIRRVYNYQMEINRAASQDATNMQSFGWDCVFTNASSSVEFGKDLTGIKHYKVAAHGTLKDSFLYVQGTGVPKFTEYWTSLIKAMDYEVNLDSSIIEKTQPSSGDISYVLFSRIHNKAKFQIIASRKSDFDVKCADKELDLLRYYLGPGDVITAGNREDIVIMSDFKATTSRDYTLKVEPSTDTPETQLGKQIMIQNLLQYSGQNLDKEDIGMLMREYPVSNAKQLFSEFTMKYDSIVQNIIMLEKGLFPITTRGEDFTYKANRLAVRMGRPDFPFLPVPIQQMFQKFLQYCEQMAQQMANERLRLEKGMIPTTGALIGTDLYVNIPNRKGGGPVQKRLRLPQDSLRWLLETLKKQGTVMEELSQLPQAVGNDILAGVQGPAQQLESNMAGLQQQTTNPGPEAVQAALPPPQASQ